MADSRVLEIVLRARDEASKVLSEVGDAAGKTGNSIGKFLKESVADAGAAFAATTGVIYTAISAYEESQTVVAQLEAVLKSTGGVAGITADEVLNLSSALQQQTTYGDEAITGAQNLLLTFTSIGKDIFPQATKTVLDMSTALGQDLKSSSVQLGKALQDPILGVTALRRVGVNFNEQQQEVIKTLVESGHTLDAQKLILKELATEFGGSATAQAKTFSGQMTILKNNVNDLQETIGKGLIDTISSLGGGFDNVNKHIVSLNEYLTKHKDILTAVAATLLIVALTFGGIFVAALLVVAGTAGLIVGAIGLVVGVLVFAAVMIKFHWTEIQTFFQTLYNNFLTWFNGIVASVTQTFTSIGASISGFLTGVGASLYQFFMVDIPTAIDNAVNWFTSLPSRIWTYLVDLFLTKIPFAVGFAAGYLSVVVPQMIDSVVNWFATLPDRVNTWINQMIFMIIMALIQLMIDLDLTLTAIINNITNWFSQLPGIATLWFNNMKNSAVNLIVGTGTSVSTEVSSWPKRIETFISSIPSIVANVFEQMKQGALNKMSELWQGITGWWDKIKGIFDAIGSTLSGIIDKAKQGFSAGKQAGMQFADGGWVPHTGLALVHGGEYVLSRDMLAGREPVMAPINTNNSNINVGPVYVQGPEDIETLSHRLSFMMSTSGAL